MTIRPSFSLNKPINFVFTQIFFISLSPYRQIIKNLFIAKSLGRSNTILSLVNTCRNLPKATVLYGQRRRSPIRRLSRPYRCRASLAGSPRGPSPPPPGPPPEVASPGSSCEGKTFQNEAKNRTNVLLEQLYHLVLRDEPIRVEIVDFEAVLDLFLEVTPDEDRQSSNPAVCFEHPFVVLVPRAEDSIHEGILDDEVESVVQELLKDHPIDSLLWNVTKR